MTIIAAWQNPANSTRLYFTLIHEFLTLPDGSCDCTPDLGKDVARRADELQNFAKYAHSIQRVHRSTCTSTGACPGLMARSI